MEKLLTQRCSRNLFRTCMVESVSGTRIYYIYIYIHRERERLSGPSIHFASNGVKYGGFRFPCAAC